MAILLQRRNHASKLGSRNRMKPESRGKAREKAEKGSERGYYISSFGLIKIFYSVLVKNNPTG